MLATPGFHHLHLNSVDPDAAIDLVHAAVSQHAARRLERLPGAAIAQRRADPVRQGRCAAEPANRKARSGILAGMSPMRARALETFKARPEVTLLPLYTTDAGGSVLISSDTWPGTGGVPGRTAAQIEQAIGATASSRPVAAGSRI